MKKLSACLLIFFLAAGASAFDKGTKNIGVLFNYTSIKAKYGAEADTYFEFQGQLGYFAVKNISIDFAANMAIQPNYYDYDYDRDSASSTTMFNLGFGSRIFFYDRLYLGSHFYQQFYDRGDANIISFYLDFDAGMLAPITENVYFDFGVQYDMGIGNYSGVDDYGYINKNEESSFSLRAGLALYLKKK